MMKIVILDASPLDKDGGISWERIQALGEVTIYPRTSADQVVERIQQAEVVLTNKVVLDEAILSQCPTLKHIAVMATGFNIIDGAYAKSKGITVSNIPAYSTDAVAQQTFALILGLTNHLHHHSEFVRSNDWAKHEDFAFWHQPVYDLKGKTLGLYGFGTIAQEVAKIALAFGMEVIAHRRSDKTIEGVRLVSLDELLAASDILSLHAPLTAENKDLFGTESFSKMKKSALLINTARGPLIDEMALAKALNRGEIAGAGLDVMCQEPPQLDHPLYKIEQCLISPHMAWASVESRLRLMDILEANIKAYAKGEPQNIVN
ncbi:D-2-hydroxyacid dehydrogenase [Persicobacter psychrovividus]|uniref:Glycerate dehydrogenase n=1 Tax=Persicobacter psychrovividus TaxID=387638 RepID=A0ABN6LCK2_9BACT|nr:glycerate dehydrogenase [Persicobacter psychrovividus]